MSVNQGGGQPQQQPPQQQTPPPPPPRPDYIEDKFWDPTSNSIKVEDLAKSYKEIQGKFSTRQDDLRRQIEADFNTNRLKARPPKPDDYSFTLPEGVLKDGEEFEFDQSNPLVGFWRKHAHEHGLNQSQFADGVAAILEGFGHGIPDPEQEIRKLGEKGRDRLRAVEAFLSTVPEKSRNHLRSLTTSAAGIEAIEELMSMTKDHAQTGGGGSPFGSIRPAPLTREQLNKMVADPRYADRHKRDPEFVRQVDEGFKRLYPNQKR